MGTIISSLATYRHPSVSRSSCQSWPKRARNNRCLLNKRADGGVWGLPEVDQPSAGPLAVLSIADKLSSWADGAWWPDVLAESSIASEFPQTVSAPGWNKRSSNSIMRSFVTGCRQSITTGWISIMLGSCNLRSFPPTETTLCVESHSGTRLDSRLCNGTSFCNLRAATSPGKLWAWHALSNRSSASWCPMGWSLAGSIFPEYACLVASISFFHVLNPVASGVVKPVSTAVKLQKIALFHSDEPAEGAGSGLLG